MKQSVITKAAAASKAVFKRWSYSSWSLYNECGARFEARYLNKLPEPPSPAMARGTDLHTKAEYWVQGKLKGPVPNGLKKLEAEFGSLRAMKPRVEQWFGVNQNWTVAKYDSWCVGKLDADVLVDGGKELIIIDYKSGRVYADKHQQQASLYTALGAAHFPKVDKITAEFWYLDQGDVLTWSWPATQFAGLQKEWGAKGAEVMAHPNLEPRPGYYCRWCSLSKQNGGACPKG
jgi:hypothetical protein